MPYYHVKVNYHEATTTCYRLTVDSANPYAAWQTVAHYLDDHERIHPSKLPHRCADVLDCTSQNEQEVEIYTTIANVDPCVESPDPDRLPVPLTAQGGTPMTDEQYHQHLQQTKRSLQETLALEGLPPTTITRILARHSQIHAALSAYQRALRVGYDAHMDFLSRPPALTAEENTP